MQKVFRVFEEGCFLVLPVLIILLISFPSELPLKALFLLLIDTWRCISEIALVSPATLPVYLLADI